MQRIGHYAIVNCKEREVIVLVYRGDILLLQYDSPELDRLVSVRARFTNVDQAWTKFKFDLELGLAVIFVAPTQFRISNHELNSVYPWTAVDVGSNFDRRFNSR